MITPIFCPRNFVCKGSGSFFDALGKEPKAESQEEPKLKKSAVISTAACLHVFSASKL